MRCILLWDMTLAPLWFVTDSCTMHPGCKCFGAWDCEMEFFSLWEGRAPSLPAREPHGNAVSSPCICFFRRPIALLQIACISAYANKSGKKWYFPKRCFSLHPSSPRSSLSPWQSISTDKTQPSPASFFLLIHFLWQSEDVLHHYSED